MKNVKEGYIEYRVTRDSGANVKLLKHLERAGCITIYDVMLENGRDNRKVKDKVLPVAVMDRVVQDGANALLQEKIVRTMQFGM